MIVGVESVVPGDLVVLPNGREVTVDTVSRYPDEGLYVVNWWRPAERGEAGYPRDDRPQGDHNDGRYLGSLKQMRAGDPVTVVDRVAVRRIA